VVLGSVEKAKQVLPEGIMTSDVFNKYLNEINNTYEGIFPKIMGDDLGNVTVGTTNNGISCLEREVGK